MLRILSVVTPVRQRGCLVALRCSMDDDAAQTLRIRVTLRPDLFADVEQIATFADVESAQRSVARLLADFAAGRPLELSVSG